MYLSCRRKPEYSEETGMHREKIRLLAVKQQLLPYLSVLCHVACSLICVELWVRKILFCMQFSCYWKINVYFTKVIYRTQSGLFWQLVVVLNIVCVVKAFKLKARFSLFFFCPCGQTVLYFSAVKCPKRVFSKTD